MDIEHLNKTQIVLLTLLVSFVTSIATGIVTVSLMNQAPPEIAATVNHIIERTVKEVTPAAQAPAGAASAVKTVVVKNDDLTAQSIANVQKSIVRIVRSDAPETLVARGVVTDAHGVVMTDRGSLDPSASYEVIFPDGSKTHAVIRKVATTSATAFLDLEIGTTTPPLTAAVFADPSTLALGQSVIRIGGNGADTVGSGVIAQLPKGKDYLEASIASATPGSLLISLFGEVIGMTTSESANAGSDFYSLLVLSSAAGPSAAQTQGGASTSASRP